MEETPRDLSLGPPRVVEFPVGRRSDGMRLDVFLAERLDWRSRTSVQREVVEAGRVRVDGSVRTKNARTVRCGETVAVTVPPPAEEMHHDVELEVAWEDRDLVAVHKPAGMVCHPTDRYRVNTLINILHHHYRVPDEPEEDVVPKLCHRLDAETSGVLLVAKSTGIRRAMQEVFEARKVRKTYLAIVRGAVEADRGCIDRPLARDPASRVKMMVADDGAPSHTHFEVVERPGGEATLLRLWPLTGRQHQLRVHLVDRGHPILGDPLYGRVDRDPRAGFVPGRLDLPAEQGMGPPRQALHACRLEFPHPRTGARVTVEDPLPADLRAEVERLREGGELPGSG